MLFSINKIIRKNNFLKGIFLFVFFFFSIFNFQINNAEAVDPPWYNSSWGYRKKITIDHTKVQSTNQTNFPVLVNRTDVNWKDTGNGGHVGQSDGGDILFTSSDGTTKLSHEIEKYTSTTGELVAWIKIPTLSTSVDTDIYIYYGNATVANQWDVANTWDANYKAVYHLPNGTSLTALDSTSNAYNGTLSGTPPTATTGQADGGAIFAGSPRYVSLPATLSAPIGAVNYVGTISFWAKSGSGNPISAYRDSSNQGGYAFLTLNTTFSYTNCDVLVNPYCHTISSATSFTSGNWNHFVFTSDGSGHYQLAVNGVVTPVTYTFSTIPGSFPRIMMGLNHNYSYGDSYYTGSLDDVRVSNSTRSADWITTEYNNQSSPSTFYAVAGEEAYVAPTIPNPPTDLVLTAGNTQVSLSWTAPAENGGSPITDYVIDYKLSSEPTVWSTFADGVSAGTTGTVTGITNGLSYDFRVSAVNIIGQGDPSVTATVTPATIPGVPTSLIATPSDIQVSLSWTAPVSNGGSAVTDYVIDYKLSSEPTVWSTFADGVSAGTSGIVTGLSNGHAYDFRVSAVNIMGQGSSSGTTSTTPAAVPGIPVIGTATAGNTEASVAFLPPSYPWYNSSWGYRKKITIDHTKVQSTNQTNFPVLVNRTDVNWKDTGNGGHVGQSDGGDILFTSSDGTTKLSHEIEKYTSTTGELVAWIKIPTLSTSVDTDIYIYYGNATVANQWDVANTWDANYKAVYHLPDPTNPVDSTGVNNGTNVGSVSTTGEIDGAAIFNGIDQYISLPVSLSVPMGFFNYVGTISFWAKSGVGYPIAIYRTSPDQGSYAYFEMDATTLKYTNCDVLVLPYCHSITSATSFTSSNWNHFVFTSDGSGNYQLAVNGVVTPTTYSFASIPGSYSRIMIAYLHNHTYNDSYYTGSLDDVRVSNSVRSANWITTEYNNQSSPSTFYAVAGEETEASPIDNDGGSSITGYTATSNPGSITGTGASSPIVVTGLTNGTSYTFTVTATNSIGTSSASSASNAVVPGVVPGSPTALSATAGNAQVSLAWSSPAYDGGISITDYVIDYKLSSEPTVWSTFTDGVSTTTSGTVTGLTNGLSYDFKVSAVNSFGQGSYSSTATATPITIPGAPTSIVATRGNTQASVSFSAPVSNGGSTITTYTVTSNPESHVSTGSSSPIIVTGLTNGTAYTFTITATNAAGTGPDSSASNSVIPATTPDAPTSPSAVAGNAQVTLSWTAPVLNGGDSITDYAIEYKLSSEPTVWSTFADGVSTSTSGIVTGLTNGLSYDFRISAVNSVGQGSISVETNAMPVTVPDAPIIGTATPSNAQVSVAFTPPVFNGGSTINNYTVTSIPGGFTGTGSSSPIVVTGLTNGTTYTFTVTATNAIGTSAPSSASESVVPVTVPDAPTSISAIEGNTQASVSFTPPVFNGGSTINNYTVTSIPGGFTGTGSSSPIVVTGLTNGTTYTFTVTATNSVGTSSSSSASNSVTLSTEPGVPVNLASTVLGSSVGLSWSAPVSNGGSVITDYIIEYQLSTGGVWSVFSDGTSINTTATVTGLSNGISYDFRISAVNIIGQSVPSDFVTASPGEPAQVLIQSFPDLTAQNISTNVRITNEGSVQYEYQYTWCVTDAVDNLCGSGDDIFSASNAKLIQPAENWDTNLVSTISSPGDFYFHIKVLYGSQSSSAYQSFTAVATFPDAPVIGTATRGNTEASITFAPSVSNGGSAITGYTVTSSPGGFTGTGSSSPIVVTGLTNGTTYTFTVTATNSVGTSSSSSASNAVVPATIPDAPTGLTPTAGNSQVSLSWTAPVVNGGSAITDYVIEYKLTSESTVWSTFADGVSAITTGTVTGLTNGLSYDFRVSAVNEVGQSSVNGSSASPINNTPPPAPPSGGGGGGGGGGYPIWPLPQTTPPIIPTPIETEIVPPVVDTKQNNTTSNPPTKKPQQSTITTTPSLPTNTKQNTIKNKNEVSATPKENPKPPILELIKIDNFNYEIIIWAFSISFILIIIFYFVIRYRRRE